MTTRQRITLMAELWPNACAAQGWTDDRAKRLEVLSTALIQDGRRPAGFLLDTASDIDHLKDYDAVKSYLLALAQPSNFEGQVAVANMPRTRVLYAIRKFGFHDNYLASIPRLDPSTHGTALEHLPIAELENIRNNLANRARRKKKKAVSVFPTTNEAEKMDMLETNKGHEVLAELTDENPF